MTTDKYNGKRKFIICADDDPSIRALYDIVVGEHYRELGYNVEIFDSGKAFEERLKRSSESNYSDIAAAVIDGTMPPGRNGLEIIGDYSRRKNAPTNYLIFWRHSYAQRSYWYGSICVYC